MNKSEVIQTIKSTGVIPVVRAASADQAMRAIEAIKEGGLSVLEITMTVPGAVRVIEVVPTGGVSLATAADFIKAGASAVGVGSELVDVKALRQGQAGLITERARQ